MNTVENSNSNPSTASPGSTEGNSVVVIQPTNQGKELKLKKPKSFKDDWKSKVKVPVALGIVIIAFCAIIGLMISIILDNDPNRFVIIRNKKQFSELKPEIRFIRFRSNCCNEEDFTDLSFTQFQLLEEVEIENNCLNQVQRISIQDLPLLNRISIGDQSFSKLSTNEVSNSLEIRNCSSLKEVSIGKESLRNFKQCTMESTNSIGF